MLWPGIRFCLRSQCKRCSAGRFHWQPTLVLYIHVFCYFWADWVHVLWLSTQLPAQIISQPAPAPHQVQPAPAPHQVSSTRTRPAPTCKAVRYKCGYPQLAWVNPPRAGLKSVTLWFCLQCSCKKCLQSCDSASFNAMYYVRFCLLLSTCVLQSVCSYYGLRVCSQTNKLN